MKKLQPENQEVIWNVLDYVLPLQKLFPNSVSLCQRFQCGLHRPPELVPHTTSTVIKKVKPKAPRFQFPI